MNKRQLKIYQDIIRYRHLDTVLKRNNIADYLELQDIIDPKYIDFSDNKMDHNTTISIRNDFIGEVESDISHKHHLIFSEIRAWITAIIAVAAFVKSFFF